MAELFGHDRGGDELDLSLCDAEPIHIPGAIL
jgi:light-regulated signal transduction histidine kinase (bacteriophytochrome)